ncbi:MAG: hypothetical protein ACOX1L_01020 [Erysipelotrichaceae bacterium]|jgi:hypothetical protein
MDENKLIEEIKEILLKHKCSEKRITSGEIARRLNIDPDDQTTLRTRNLIRKTMEETGLPIAANSKGYCIITSEDEYKNYINNLRARRKGIKERMSLVEENWKKYDEKNNNKK